MEWLNSLFFEHTPLQAVVILSIIIAVGLGLGKIHLFGISLGVTFVFFAGILAGHLGFSIDPNMLNYAESFGLVLFVYELGLQVGPGFFSSFRKGGVQLNMLGIGVILTGTVMTVLFSKLGGIPMSDMVGILCGATTNTPALGAAQQTLKQMGEPASGAALSCAVTYPLGVVGVILAMLLVRKLFVRPSDIDIHEHEDTNQTFIATFKVHNPAIFNKSIKEVALLSYPKFVISRLWREGTVSIPTSEKILKENDRLLVKFINPEQDFHKFRSIHNSRFMQCQWIYVQNFSHFSYQIFTGNPVIRFVLGKAVCTFIAPAEGSSKFCLRHIPECPDFFYFITDCHIRFPTFFLINPFYYQKQGM